MNRRAVSLLSVLLATGGTSLVLAQPKQGAPTPAPAPAPAPDPAAPPADGATPVTMPEDPPPADMDGKDENPDVPRGMETGSLGVTVPAKKARSGYPIEETLRPITLPENMSEVSISPHLQIDNFEVSDALRARYGITRQIQIGLTYLYAGIYNEPSTAKKDYAVHGGKTVAVDVTVLLQDWIGVRVAIPVYIDPLAVGLNIGAPMKFIFADKLAIGALDDLLEINVSDKFAPSLYSEQQNANQAFALGRNDETSTGALRFSVYGSYQHSEQLALTARFGIRMEDVFRGENIAGASSSVDGTTTNLRVGLLYAVKKYLDVGGSLGFENIAEPGTFGPLAFLNVRI